MKDNKFYMLILNLFAMQAECEDCDDTGDFPVATTGLNTQILKVPGGYRGFALKKCSYDFTDISDSVEWEAAIASNDVVVVLSCQWILGSKSSDATVNTEGSCEVEDIADRTPAFTFVHSGDNAAYDIDNFFISWQTKNGEGYDLAPIKCDDVTIRDFYSGTANVNLNTDETKSGKESWTVVFTSHQLAENAKILLPFGVSTLTGI